MLIHSYRVLRQIGSGNFSHVFLGEHKKQKEKQVAIKIGQVSGDTSIAHESRILRHLNMELPSSVRDYVPTLIWYGRFGTTQLSMIMTYYPLSLESFLQGNNEISIDEIFSQILSVISYIHNVGILHRDIKLDNFMVHVSLDSDIVETHVVLIDFGFAQSIENQPNTLGEDNLIGTPNYTSYFLYEGFPYSKRDDLISVLYLFMELLRIQWPWNSKEADSLVKFQHDEYPPYHRLHSRNRVRAHFKKKEYLMNYLVNYPILSILVERFYSLNIDNCERPNYSEYIRLFNKETP